MVASQPDRAAELRAPVRDDRLRVELVLALALREDLDALALRRELEDGRQDGPLPVKRQARPDFPEVGRNLRDDAGAQPPLEHGPGALHPGLDVGADAPDAGRAPPVVVQLGQEHVIVQPVQPALVARKPLRQVPSRLILADRVPAAALGGAWTGVDMRRAGLPSGALAARAAGTHPRPADAAEDHAGQQVAGDAAGAGHARLRARLAPSRVGQDLPDLFPLGAGDDRLHLAGGVERAVVLAQAGQPRL